MAIHKIHRALAINVERVQRILVVATFLGAAIGTTGCVPSQLYAYRVKDDITLNCKPDKNGEVAKECGELTHEHAVFDDPENNVTNGGYDLLFAEFDDAGWANRPATDTAPPRVGLETDGANEPPDDEISRIKTFLQSWPCRDPIRVVVFVHGWKHSAASDDGNVEWARKQLRALAEVENNHGRRVVGIYIGWRGTPIKAADPILDTTFWDRMGVAEHVAQGSVNEVLAYVSAFEKKCNAPEYAGSVPGTSHNVVTLFLGHSFGGLILFEALEPKILESVVSAGFNTQPIASTADTSQDKNAVPRPSDALQRDVDMVVLVNPAIEATRFQPLFRAMKYRNYNSEHAPLMVLLTSTADWATGYAFRVARSVTLAENNSAQEREAYKNTIGHVDAYITHDLVRQVDGKPSCVSPLSNPESLTMCFGENVLTARNRNYNRFPVWNISTDATEIKNHDDISETQFIDFIASLTRYGVALPVMIEMRPPGMKAASQK